MMENHFEFKMGFLWEENLKSKDGWTWDLQLDVTGACVKHYTEWVLKG